MRALKKSRRTRKSSSDPTTEASPSYRVESETTNQLSTRKRRGKKRAKETSTSVQTVTNKNTGEVSTTKTTSVDKSKTNRRGETKSKSKIIEDFKVTDSEGRVLLKDRARISSRNGKTRTKRKTS